METYPENIPFRILIVDDDPKIGELVQEFLVEKGYEAFYTYNGTNALRLVQKARPHVVLLDIHMDDMNGLEVLKRIVKLDPKTIVMMLTGLYEEDTGQEALRLGAVDYITKPVNFNYLETSIRLKLSSLLE